MFKFPGHLLRVCIIHHTATLWPYFTNLNCKSSKQEDKKEKEKDQKVAL